MLRLSHRGVCVSDIARSERFYCEALDFAPYQDDGTVSGPDIEQTTELAGVQLRCKMLKHRDGPVLQLLQFLSPESFGPRERRSTLQYGLVHLSFYVDDIDAAAAKIAAAGGAVHEETRAHYPEGGTTLLYCTDPDGVRVELMHAQAVPGRFSHSGICVNDIDVSIGFYQELGFSPVENYVLDEGMDWLSKINEVPGIKLRAQMMKDSEGNVIELLKVFEPDCFGPRERRKLNQFGLTHLAFWDDAPDATATKLTQRGGHFVEDAHVVMSSVELQQGADPDGVRIELMKPLGS